MTNTNQIVFFDTTLRDGEQSLGVDILEAGFAIASDGDFEAIRAVAREVRGPRIASLARCKREDIEAAARAVEPAPYNRIHLVLASSDLHLEYNLRITRDQALDQAAESVRFARSFTEDVEFSTEDGTRTDPEFLLKMITVAVQAGPPPSTSPTPSASPLRRSTPRSSAWSRPAFRESTT
jgi:2-isopropylmalate synthase